MSLHKTAVLIGNSDGIGLQTTYLLLAQGYKIIGISRSNVSIDNANYQHIIQDVTGIEYRSVIQELISSLDRIDVCIYFAGIGEFINLANLRAETTVFHVNLLSAVITTEVLITKMLQQGYGHFIGLSSVMDIMIAPRSPSYSASKAAVSLYWESLAFAVKSNNIKISNIRFGFVNTKMAKSPLKFMLLSSKDAAQFVLKIINRPRVRATKPLLMGFIIWLYSLQIRLNLLFK